MADRYINNGMVNFYGEIMALTTLKEFAKNQGIKPHAMQQRIWNFYGDKWPERTRVGKNLMFDHDADLKCCAENPWFNKGGLNLTGSRKPKVKKPFEFSGLIFDFLTGKYSPKEKKVFTTNNKTVTVKINEDL